MQPATKSSDDLQVEIEKIKYFIRSERQSVKKPRRGQPVTDTLLHLFDHLVRESPKKAIEESELVTLIGKNGGTKGSAARDLVTKLRRYLEKYLAGPGARSHWRVRLPSQQYNLTFETHNISSGTSESTAPSLAAADEVWDLVLAICHERGIKADDAESKFWDWVKWKGKDFSPRSAFLVKAAKCRSQDHPEERVEFFRHLKGLMIPLAEMRGMAAALDVDELMLDPLLSHPIDANSLVVGFEEGFFAPPLGAERGSENFRKGGWYEIPRERLRNTHAAFVHLLLEDKGQSDRHDHPGDEMLMVVRGEVRVALSDSGVEVTLRKGDYIHFYAEQRHIVHANQESELFIIRFYQYGAAGTRQSIRRDVAARLENGEPLDNLTLAWVKQLILSEPHMGPSEVNDRLGLARFLRRTRKWRNPAMEEFGHEHTDEKMKGWERAEREVGAGDLGDVATRYSIETILLSSYLYPAIPNLVVVRRHEDMELIMPADDEPIAGTSGEQKKPKTTYRIPKWNLSCSDISIAELTLEPGAETPENDHPGFELLFPFEGEAVVQVREPDGSLRDMASVASEQSFAHYTSEKTHKVVNRGSKDAVLLVVRFYRDGPA